MCECWSMLYGCCNKDAREAGYDCDECPYYKEDSKE